MQNLLVRNCSLYDLNAILKIEEESFPDSWKRKLLEKELSLPFSVFLVAELRGKIVGYLIAWIIGEICELNKIAVASRLRGRRIGEKLLKELINECQERKVKEIFLEVRESNFSAIKLYERVGFKRVSIRERYYGCENAVVYKLNLGGKYA
ncbi:ribosomal protein S18-alanine N-acetyltransferase [Desulfurobacterium thermolithotrophum]|uniref:ribosomal protein S18-alanine N-acetyltransferase n=1 Tax=Desulfurobacterium thermolithotrophum TaxID=64160 RepID=UPI0013D5C1CD|nr:ribosomal protein S18-alanine N-acetyltransferase [Desulfurobacterium thermolithotrophum]